jgi:hypothetical protein
MRQSAPAQRLKESNPAPFRRNVRISTPAYDEAVVNCRTGRDAVWGTMNYVFGFAELVKNLFAGTYERQTALESIRVKTGVAQSKDLTARSCGCNQNARSTAKITIQQWSFPVEKPLRLCSFDA